MSNYLLHSDFGGFNNLPPVSGNYYEFNNEDGYNSIGFYLTIPLSGRVQFQGSFDGTNYSPIVFRSVGADGYTQIGSNSDSFIGSISTLKKVRFVVFTGFTTGSVQGRVTNIQNTLEGIENQSPPHKIGNQLFHTGFNIASNQTSGIIFTPTIGKKFVITDLNFSVGAGSASAITFFDETDSTENWLHSSDYENAPSNGAIRTTLQFRSPFVSSATNNRLRITNSGARAIRGVIHGYLTD